MSIYWAEFVNRPAACVQANDRGDAAIVALEFGEVIRVRSLPYAALPMLNEKWHTVPFCYSPETCAGKTSCPKSRSCVD